VGAAARSGQTRWNGTPGAISAHSAAVGFVLPSEVTVTSVPSGRVMVTVCVPLRFCTQATTAAASTVATPA
jgi:hypothetical protein